MTSKYREMASETTSLLNLQEDLLLTDELASSVGLSVHRLPESLQEADIAEKVLSEEMEKLSVTEHEKVIFDVLGFGSSSAADNSSSNTGETRNDSEITMSSANLEELEQELQKIRDKPDYERAHQLNPDFCRNRLFRSMFLHVEDGNAKAAALKIVKHFQLKAQLFGSGPVLCRKVILSDLSQHDMLALESGAVQVLPTRDVAGRTIVFIAHMLKPTQVTMDNCLRARWYIFNTLEKQWSEPGIVGIVYNAGNSARQEPFQHVQTIRQFRAVMPVKCGGIHYCCDNPQLRPFVTGVRLFQGKNERIRWRSHFGSYADIQFKLQTHGIPMESMPLSSDGTVTTEWHKEWLQLRRQKEEGSRCSETSSTAIYTPRRFDVLFGRTKKTREHTGNLRAEHIMEMHRAKYEVAGKFEKTAIAERIVHAIHESHGRFLRWEHGDGWVEVDNEVARDKISHCFRNKRSKEGKKIDDKKDCERKRVRA